MNKKFVGKWDYITKEELEELYINQNLSKPEIRKILGIPQTSLGRLLEKYSIYKDKETLKKMQSRIVYDVYANRTEEVRLKKVQKLKDRWNNYSKEEKEKWIRILSEVNSNRTPEHQAKLTKSFKDHLANETEEQKAERKARLSKACKIYMNSLSIEKKIARYKKVIETVSNWSEEKRAEVRKHHQEAMQKKSYEEKQASIQKGLETKRKNHTFNTSKDELIIKDLLKEKFKSVKVQYRSNVYPFRCDFYIEDIDTYIEYQGYWHHGKYSNIILGPYDENNEEHKRILQQWKKKAEVSKYYQIAIKVWTISDPLKRKTAKENNLNWLEFFTMKVFMVWHEKI